MFWTLEEEEVDIFYKGLLGSCLHLVVVIHIYTGSKMANAEFTNITAVLKFEAGAPCEQLTIFKVFYFILFHQNFS